MPLLSACRRAHRQGSLQGLRALGFVALMIISGAARADALDDTLARFLDDKFPQSEKAIAELAAEAPPQGAAVLTAKPGETIPAANAAAFKKVHVNNGLRRSIDGAMGSLTLANPDPQKRLTAAGNVFKTRDAKALPALEAQIAKES